MDLLEYTMPNDPFYDFCLWEYDSGCDSKNKIRSVNLLFHSFTFAGADSRAFGLVEKLRQEIGFFQTVYGVKQIGGKLTWEFYFYDYRRRGRERSMSRVIEALRPFAHCSVRPNENLHYFMFSLDIDNDLLKGVRDIDEIHMYIGNPGSTVSSGICYSLSSSGTSLENFYFFFDAKKQKEDILDKAFCSAYLDTACVKIDQIFWPQMQNCKVMVVANKQGNDAVYFSGIDIDQLIFFLKTMKYPPEIVAFVVDNRANLDHLCYDVGFDYKMEEGGLVILKSGYYGIF